MLIQYLKLHVHVNSINPIPQVFRTPRITGVIIIEMHACTLQTLQETISFLKSKEISEKKKRDPAGD